MISRRHRLGLVLVMALACLTGYAEVQLLGDSSEPTHSLFVPGQQVVLKFGISGLPEDTKEVLTVNVVNEHGHAVRDYSIPLVLGSNDSIRIRFEEAIWKVDLYAPTNRLGFFQAFAKLSSGIELPQIASRPAGYLTYAIVPNPFERKAYPPDDTFFGLMGAFEGGFMGASWNVMSYQQFTWEWFEPDRPGQFEEKIELEEAEKRFPLHFEESAWFNVEGKGGRLPSYRYMYIGTAPAWGSDRTTRTHLTATLTPAGEAGFREFCLKLGRYMATTCSNEPVHYYQITAEPEFPWGFKGSVEDLIRIYEIAYPALHEADPNAVVGGVAIGVNCVEEYRELLQKGLGKYIDVLDFHPYLGRDTLPQNVNLIGKIREYKSMLAEYAPGRNIRMAGTESGYDNSGETTEVWLKKAHADVHQNLILLGEGFWFNTCFHGADMALKPGENTWGFFFNLDAERQFGIRKGSPKPVAPAYAVMSQLLEGYKTAGPIEWLGADTCGYAYERSNDVILALWSYTPCDVAIPVGVERVQVLDWMGNASTVSCPDGVLSLSLSEDPHYVRRVSPSLWGSKGKGKPLTIKSTERRVLPGDKVTISCQLVGTLPKGLKDRLLLSANEALKLEEQTRAISLKKGARREESFEITIPADTVAGNYPLAFRVLDGDTPLAGDGLTLRVDPAISILQATPGMMKNQQTLGVLLQAPLRKAAKGKLVVASVDGLLPTKEIPFTLKAGEKRRYDLPLQAIQDLRQQAALTITATTDAGALATKAVSFDITRAQRMEKKPVIDGDLVEWEHIPAISLADASAVVGGNVKWWKDTADHSAEVKLAWDTEALYLACDVTDDTHWQRIVEMTMSSDDGLKLGVNLDPENAHITGAASVESGILRRWHEFCFGERLDGKPWRKAGRLASYDERFAPAGELPFEKLPFAMKRDGVQTRYEIAVPWTLLNREKPPRAGEAIGLALAIGDRDLDPENEGATWENYSALGLYGGLNSGRDVSKYGWVVLTGVSTAKTKR